MTTTEALNVLKPSGNTQGSLKSAYRQACKRYHPDVNPNGLELMKVINAAYAYLRKNMGTWDCNQQTSDISITEKMQAIFDKIKHLAEIQAEVCGSWLWVSGNTYPHKGVLKQAGLFWAKKKQQWYWRPAEYAKRGKKVFSMDQIRLTYGSVELRQEPVRAIA